MIITVDDDVIYNLDMAKRLYLSYLEFPDSVHAHWITKIFVWKDDKIKTLHGGTYYSGAHILNKLTGVGGVLYPRNCFHKDVLNAELVMKLAPENDDVWFWCMANLNGYYVRLIKNKIINVKYIDGTQGVGLWYNVNNVKLEGRVFSFAV